MGGIKIDPFSPVNPSEEIQKDKNQEDRIKTLTEISVFEQMLRDQQEKQKAQSEKAEEKEEKPEEVSQETYQQVSLQHSYYLLDRLINQSKKDNEEKEKK